VYNHSHYDTNAPSYFNIIALSLLNFDMKVFEFLF